MQFAGVALIAAPETRGVSAAVAMVRAVLNFILMVVCIEER